MGIDILLKNTALMGEGQSDEDAETRSEAAGVVLSVIGGERVRKTSSHGTEISEFILSEDSEPPSISPRRKASKTNDPPATAAQICT